jgi:hypothetical protein
MRRTKQEYKQQSGDKKGIKRRNGNHPNAAECASLRRSWLETPEKVQFDFTVPWLRMCCA